MFKQQLRNTGSKPACAIKIRKLLELHFISHTSGKSWYNMRSHSQQSGNRVKMWCEMGITAWFGAREGERAVEWQFHD